MVSHSLDDAPRSRGQQAEHDTMQLEAADMARRVDAERGRRRLAEHNQGPSRSVNHVGPECNAVV